MTTDRHFYEAYIRANSPGYPHDTSDMMFPVRCRHCGRVYDLAKVTVTARYTDCSMWKTPCCKILADDRKPPWGIAHYEELTPFVAADWHGPECEDTTEEEQ